MATTLADACRTDSSTDSVNSLPSTPQHVSSVSIRGSLNGPKLKLIYDGDIQLCRLNHTRTIVSKIMNSKYLRRWESHRLILDHGEIRSATVSFALL